MRPKIIIKKPSFKNPNPESNKDITNSKITFKPIERNQKPKEQKPNLSITSSQINKNNLKKSNNSQSVSESDNEIRKKDSQASIFSHSQIIDEKESSFQSKMPTSKNEDKKFLKDKKENEDNQKAEKIIYEISNSLKNCKGLLEKEMEEIKKHKDFFDKKNFILTDLSCKRMAEIIHYIKSGNPVLLEGDTGTAKTRTSVIACEYLMEYPNNNNYDDENNEDEDYEELSNSEHDNSNYIKFNLSADTKIDNLMNKYVGDSKSVTGIKIESGAFYKAFKHGKILILDEINLASKEVLDCIGQALDSKVLSTELTGKELKSCKMHKNFALIATQNPLKGSFVNKRQNLGYAFFSRFQKVNCFKFNEDELYKIANGLAKKENINIDEKILENIIKFHIEWEKENSKDSEDIFYFTIREIETVINALKDKNNSPYSIIMNVYGSRYPKNEKEKMKLILNKYDNLKEKNNIKINLPKEFPKCFKNDNLIQAVNSILFSLNNHRHIIIVGEEESGITQIARWSAEFFSKNEKSKDNTYLCICSKKLQCEDLIGIDCSKYF